MTGKYISALCVCESLCVCVRMEVMNDEYITIIEV